MRFSGWVVNSLDQEDYAFDFEVRPPGFVVRHDEASRAAVAQELAAAERLLEDARLDSVSRRRRSSTGSRTLAFTQLRRHAPRVDSTRCHTTV